MNVLYSGPGRLRLRISQSEAAHLAFDEQGRINCEDHATRLALLALLERARTVCGFSASGKLNVDSTRDQDGYILTFTLSQKRGISPVVFQFSDAESLIDGSLRLYQQYGRRIYKSSLYGWDPGYRMVMLPLDYADRLSIYFLSEYARNVGEGAFAAAFTEEHGRFIIKDNAVETLVRHFGDGEPQIL